MDDFELYSKALEKTGKLKEYLSKAKLFETQLTLSTFNKECNEKLIYKNSAVKPRQTFFDTIEGLEGTCKKCWSFYLSPRNKSIKGLDVQLGKQFELVIIDFLNSVGIHAEKTKNRGEYPDISVFDVSGKLIAFIELKYQSSPWLFAFKEEGTKRECYEGSPAVDIKKINQQTELVLNGKIDVPIIYLFWLDFPCVKGLFHMELKELKSLLDSGSKVFERKLREGDVSEKGKKGQTSKIHPSISAMQPISSLIAKFGR